MLKTIVENLNKNNQEQLIKLASDVILKGGLVVLPTDTVYGLSCNAFNMQSVKRVCDVKNRSIEKPFPICVSGVDMLLRYADQISEDTMKLIKKFWPGSLTIIVKTKNDSGFIGNVGFRAPNASLLQSLCREVQRPIVITSANISGSPSTSQAEDALRDLEGKVELVLCCDDEMTGKESTVIDMSGDTPKIIRIGGISLNKIRDCLRIKVKNILVVCTGNSCRSVMAEGVLKEIFCNRIDVFVHSAGVCAFQGMPPAVPAVYVMSEAGINIAGKRANILTPQMVDDADKILVMTDDHKRAVTKLACNKKEAEDKTRLIMNYSDKLMDKEKEVPDPIGMPFNIYRQCIDLMRPAIEKFARSI
ncbi:MAG: L-threonylcarbamoyladenylate synthase [Candidatus Theseobacter exili]|nr:L-threonylcarbamoyladenylate synthase [Candidatus Theseobacter exili]